jgi:hypothetical protein
MVFFYPKDGKMRKGWATPNAYATASDQEEDTAA